MNKCKFLITLLHYLFETLYIKYLKQILKTRATSIEKNKTARNRTSNITVFENIQNDKAF